MLHGEGMAWRDMACLARCHKSGLFPGAFGVLAHLKQALVREGIPHRVYRGKSITKSAEFRQVMAVIQLLVNPHDDVALLLLLESSLKLRDGIGKNAVATLQALQDAQRSAPEPLWRILVQWSRDPQLATRTRNSVKRFLTWYERCEL
jgi:superfamily I DNA/RNA helicase